jgi:UDP-N-acetylmuramoyl-tripeptide--D-alanyl-D-alanine ligase
VPVPPPTGSPGTGAADPGQAAKDASEEPKPAAEGPVTLAEGLVVPAGVQPGNLACAVGVARALGLGTDAIASRLADLPAVGHRLEAGRSPAGFVILDDTYNSNPSGASEALAALVAQSSAPTLDTPDPTGQRLVVVTPGMVELGRRQAEENRAFAAAAALAASDLVVVGRTNRRALIAGSTVSEGAAVHMVANREKAVVWVRANLSAGDVVLYENDLPDHYP